MSRFILPSLGAMEAYVPGEQPRDKAYIKLNTNENPFPPSKKVIDAVNSAEVSDLRLYSDPTAKALKEEIAKFYSSSTGEKIDSDMVFVSNGSDESLNFLFMSMCADGAAYADITYGFYKVFAELYGIKSEVIPLRDDFTLDFDAFYQTEKTVFIANPNAPTGLTITKEQVELLCAANPDRLVVIDEAYVDFGGDSVVSLTVKYDNLAVVSTFSKSRQLAGARLGYTIANKEIISDLEKIKYSTNPYNVNRLTLIAGIEAMKDVEYFEKCRDEVISVREYTKAELIKRGFEVTDSKSNFLFARCDKISGKDFYLGLKEKGVLVRYFSQDRISDYTRITIGTKAQMDAFLKAADELIGN